jgi:hypothetical protein
MKISCVLLVLATVLSVRANCQACKGRPTDADLQMVTKLVKEEIIDDSFWAGVGSIPKTPTQLVIGISRLPVQSVYGANVIVIVPEARTVSFWKICGSEFSLTGGGGLMQANVEQLEQNQYRSFFENGGSRVIEKTVKFDAFPDFGPTDRWKVEMLDKIQHVLICFLIQNDTKIVGRSAVTFQIANFTKNSQMTSIAIPELDEFWTVGFSRNSEGLIDDVAVGREHRLTLTKSSLMKRLHDNSFARRVECKCAAP